jgi:hypothetical protein
MKNKKLSLAGLMSKANAVTTAEALNAIKGREETKCHHLKQVAPVKCEMPIMKAEMSVKQGVANTTTPVYC